MGAGVGVGVGVGIGVGEGIGVVPVGVGIDEFSITNIRFVPPIGGIFFTLCIYAFFASHEKKLSLKRGILFLMREGSDFFCALYCISRKEAFLDRGEMTLKRSAS